MGCAIQSLEQCISFDKQTLYKNVDRHASIRSARISDLSELCVLCVSLGDKNAGTKARQISYSNQKGEAPRYPAMQTMVGR
jgi:hypothetical protein